MDIYKEAKNLEIQPQDESFLEFEKRVLKQLENKRGDRNYKIAIISALASVFSALAAIIAVLK